MIKHNKFIWDISVLVLRPFVNAIVKDLCGTEHIPKHGGFLIAANHPTFMEGVLIPYFMYRNLHIKPRVLAKKSLYRSFLFRVYLNQVGSIPVDVLGGKSAEQSLKLAVKYLKKGEAILIFPEGGRSDHGKMRQGKTGIIRLAIAAQVPIIPVAVTGSYELWPVGKKFPKIKRQIVLTFGRPIEIDADNVQTIRDHTDNLMNTIQKMIDNV